MSILLADRLSKLRPILPVGKTCPTAKDGQSLEAGILSVAKLCQQVPCFEISNVADFASREQDTSGKFCSLTDLAPCSVPFGAFWMEYSIPVGYREIAKRTGVFFEIYKHDFLDSDEGWLDMNSRLFRDVLDRGLSEKDYQEAHQDLALELQKRDCPFGFSVRCHVLTQCKTRLGEGVFAQGMGHIALSHQGEILTPRILGVNNSDSKDASSAMFFAIVPALLALSFLNCKNVRTTDVSPAEKLSKSFNKRNGKPLLRYKVLDIEPMKGVLESEGGMGRNGLKKALHICRGHFATYTPEKGMLGRKLEQPVTVWKPAHVRGSKEFGEVKKDYRVKI